MAGWVEPNLSAVGSESVVVISNTKLTSYSFGIATVRAEMLDDLVEPFSILGLTATTNIVAKAAAVAVDADEADEQPLAAATLLRVGSPGTVEPESFPA